MTIADSSEDRWSRTSGQETVLCSLCCYVSLRVLVTAIEALGHFKQNNHSTVGGDGGCSFSDLLAPCPIIRVLSYSNCQRSTHAPVNYLGKKHPAIFWARGCNRDQGCISSSQTWWMSICSRVQGSAAFTGKKLHSCWSSCMCKVCMMMYSPPISANVFLESHKW